MESSNSQSYGHPNYLDQYSEAYEKGVNADVSMEENVNNLTAETFEEFKLQWDENLPNEIVFVVFTYLDAKS